MMTAYEIESIIRDDVRADIHFDLNGVERAAEYIAARFEALKTENDKLKKLLGLPVED